MIFLANLPASIKGLCNACVLKHQTSLIQSELFKIVYNNLLNQESREACLQYLANILNRNNKKSQLQVYKVKLKFYQCNNQNLSVVALLLFVNNWMRYNPQGSYTSRPCPSLRNEETGFRQDLFKSSFTENLC